MFNKPALLFSGDGYSVRGPKLMGRQSAGAGFLRAYVNAIEASEVPQAIITSPNQASTAAEAYKEAGWQGKLHLTLAQDLTDNVNGGNLYIPAPGIADFSWRRYPHGVSSYSLTGVIHTIATQAVMSQLCEMMTAPVMPWDALICTSHAGKKAVQNVLSAQQEYLKWRVGANAISLPQLPVIPLGVHASDYMFTDELRAKTRESLGIEDDDVVFIFVGRLSFHAKAHPHPMLLALQQCAVDRPSKSLHLILCGQFPNQAIQDAFNEAQSKLAPDVKHHYLDGKNPENMKKAWACADVFTSLSDNVQETFGLTPIEAMAAALPCVVSDWDGYKDTVQDGVTGFRVKTYMPSPGDGQDLMTRYDLGHDNYDMYCGQLCELVAVDVDEVCKAYGILIDIPNIRVKMGLAGRSAVHEKFEWGVVYRQYEGLWMHLNECRSDAAHKLPIPSSNRVPDRLDPFRMFAEYPTHSIDQDTRLILKRWVDEHEFNEIRNLSYHRYAHRVLPTYSQYIHLFGGFKSGEVISMGNLLSSCSGMQCTMTRRMVVWLAKVDLVKILHKS